MDGFNIIRRFHLSQHGADTTTSETPCALVDLTRPHPFLLYPSSSGGFWHARAVGLDSAHPSGSICGWPASGVPRSSSDARACHLLGIFPPGPFLSSSSWLCRFPSLSTFLIFCWSFQLTLLYGALPLRVYVWPFQPLCSLVRCLVFCWSFQLTILYGFSTLEGLCMAFSTPLLIGLLPLSKF